MFSMPIELNTHAINAPPTNTEIIVFQLATPVQSKITAPIRIATVSYTHLDVYKRQVFAFRQSNDELFDKCSHVLVGDYFALPLFHTEYRDVYKRQS